MSMVENQWQYSVRYEIILGGSGRYVNMCYVGPFHMYSIPYLHFMRVCEIPQQASFNVPLELYPLPPHLVIYNCCAFEGPRTSTWDDNLDYILLRQAKQMYKILQRLVLAVRILAKLGNIPDSNQLRCLDTIMRCEFPTLSSKNGNGTDVVK